MSLDSDRGTRAAASFLAREQIAWTNHHDVDGSLAKACHRIGIPLGVLIDANGQIAFFKSGYGIAELRAAIAKLGPEFHSVALASIGSPRSQLETTAEVFNVWKLPATLANTVARARPRCGYRARESARKPESVQTGPSLRV
jgi:hypothetical protein